MVVAVFFKSCAGTAVKQYRQSYRYILTDGIAVHIDSFLKLHFFGCIDLKQIEQILEYCLCGNAKRKS